jgi:hypothetical protein
VEGRILAHGAYELLIPWQLEVSHRIKAAEAGDYPRWTGRSTGSAT